MPDLDYLLIYLSGAFDGICVLVLVLSLLIGYAYNERMLWWHAATLTLGLMAQGLNQGSNHLYAELWFIQLALAVQALRKAAGTYGAMRQPAALLRWLSLAFVPLAVAGPGFGFLSENQLAVLLLPWFAITTWYLYRAWDKGKPWVAWLAIGQLALLFQWLFWMSLVPGLADVDPQVGSLTALAVHAVATYIGMVWMSRQNSENTLRVEARERIDPLTGLSTPRVFFDRVDGAIIRSKNLSYACAMMLIRVENIEKIVSEQQLDNAERVILAASRAIADTLRSQDCSARLAGNRFGVMAEGIEPGVANDIATRILANGLRAGEWGLQGSELQFQIVLVEIEKTDIRSPAVLLQLKDNLRHMTELGGSNRIRMLPRISGNLANPVAVVIKKQKI